MIGVFMDASKGLGDARTASSQSSMGLESVLARAFASGNRITLGGHVNRAAFRSSVIRHTSEQTGVQLPSFNSIGGQLALDKHSVHGLPSEFVQQELKGYCTGSFSDFIISTTDRECLEFNRVTYAPIFKPETATALVFPPELNIFESKFTVRQIKDYVHLVLGLAEDSDFPQSLNDDEVVQVIHGALPTLERLRNVTKAFGYVIEDQTTKAAAATALGRLIRLLFALSDVPSKEQHNIVFDSSSTPRMRQLQDQGALESESLASSRLWRKHAPTGDCYALEVSQYVQVDC